MLMSLTRRGFGATVKRWAFWPLLALFCVLVVGHALNPDQFTWYAGVIGLAVSVPIAIYIDRRRQRRRA
ncbi:MAG: hypothetical protein QOH14_552 [Pseudonocardiales bacterium]|jgi:membrane associated rhomboid family serine protease|nr:hypothetical protein [Pseudonocardiales bacterium]